MKKDITIQNLNTPKALGVAIKRLRKSANISQDALAKSLNMRQATISALENGRGTLDSFFKVIQALKVNLSVSNTLKMYKAKSTDGGKKVTKAKNLLDLLKG
ncbi:helix-turn-helix domain-containing protein [Bacteriovoracaceae bacterium]|nr:helix-turn-helix domain-containing protein [Bacteriovoracaceae bacterium]